MKRGLFIIFSGLDYSGKSTQIEFLREEFSRQGQNILVFLSRGGYTPGFQKLKNLLSLFIGKKLPKSGKSPERDKAFSNRFIRKLRPSLDNSIIFILNGLNMFEI